MTSHESFSNVRILIVGDLMLDRYWWGDVERISPEAPVPVVRLAGTTVSAGGAANVAANIVGLGASAILVGIAGDDEESFELSRILSESPSIERHLIRLSDRPTTVKTRIVAHNQHVVRLDREQSNPLSSEDERTVIDRAIPLIEFADAVIVSDYAKGMLTTTVVSELIASANALGKMIFVDPKGKDFSKYRGSTMITPNLLEAATACGLELNDPDLVVHAGAALIESLALDNALVTEGSRGMTLFDKDGESFHLDAAARNVYDVTGAGDTVIATFSVAAASGMPFKTAATLANAAAGIVVGQIGTAVVSRDELDLAVARANVK